MITRFLVVALALITSVAEARNLDLKNERLAPFLRGTFGYCLAGTSAFGGSSGNDTTFDKSANFSTGGEFGFIVTGQSLAMRISIEYLIPKQLTSVDGLNAAGTRQFSLESKMGALIPQVNFDMNLRTTNSSRFFVGGGVGMATLTLDNEYTMAPGNSYGLADHVESGEGRTLGGQGYVGYETHFTDVVSISLDLGYRYYNFTTINSTKNVTSFTGAQTAGQPLKDMAGGDRQINLSGPFSALTFRFYL